MYLINLYVLEFLLEFLLECNLTEKYDSKICVGLKNPLFPINEKCINTNNAFIIEYFILKKPPV